MNIQIDITPKQFASPEEAKKIYTDAFNKYGEDAVVKLRDKFSAVLERGAREDVGASGAASQNVLWRPMTGNEPAFEIYEGSSTIANSKIRQGLPSKHVVSYEVLRRWAADKGLKLYYDDPSSGVSPRAVLDKLTSKNGVEYERSRWFGRVGIKPASSQSPSMITKRALYAIKSALYNQGTNRPTANWFPLQPSGSGKFNYPEYVFTTQRGDIDAIMTEFGARVISSYKGVFFKGS